MVQVELAHPRHAFFEGHGWNIPKIFPRRRHVIPMGGDHLFNEELREEWLAFEVEFVVRPFAGFRDGHCDGIRNAGVAWWCTGRLEHGVDHVLHRLRLAVTDEVSFAGVAAVEVQRIQCLQVCLRGVVDVGRIDEVVAAADESQFACARAFDESWQQVIITDAPDQSWT